MKKIIAIVCMVMFVVAMALPVMADNPPAKEKQKTEAGTKKCDGKATCKKDSSKCTGMKKGCCAGKEKAAASK